MADHPFALPDTLEPELATLLAYWQGLKRGQADIPFADDVRPTAANHPDKIVLLDVLERPSRFRFAIVGDAIRDTYGSDVAGRFADEIKPSPPLTFLLAQCAATLEARAPTYYRATDHARLLLPLWGDGHINMLLGATL